jgi:cytochrome c peroxidase
MRIFASVCALVFAGCATTEEGSDEAATTNGAPPVPDPAGAFATFDAAGPLDLTSAFFQPFGTNGRTCGSCHIPKQAFTITATGVQKLFDATAGLDPLFRLVDGATSPLADVSTLEARRSAYGLLLQRGVIRVGLPIPAGAEFELAAVDDPYGFASAQELSLFRRPLPSTNLPFVPAVMWDGRETGATLAAALATQANDATLGHAQAAAPLPDATRAAIVSVELPLFTAQVIDTVAGRLDRDGGEGGPLALASTVPAPGPMDLYDAWIGLPATDPERAAKAAIARGQQIFNTRAAVGAPLRCTFCHNAANVGSSAFPVFFDIAVSREARRTPDMPLYTLRNLATGELRTTTDPGRALITGRWADVDRFKAPVLRALAARAPYFHDGSARTVRDVVRHYSVALGFQFTPAEEDDLVAFLLAL